MNAVMLRAGHDSGRSSSRSRSGVHSKSWVRAKSGKNWLSFSRSLSNLWVMSWFWSREGRRYASYTHGRTSGRQRTTCRSRGGAK